MTRNETNNIHTKGYHLNFLSPDVIESDYWGNMSFVYSGDMHIGTIVKNHLKTTNNGISVVGRTYFDFEKSICKEYNMVLMGMIFQWQKSCLEMLHAVVNQGFFSTSNVLNQKNWVEFVPGRLMKGIQECNHLLPLEILKKDLLMSYLQITEFTEGEELEFLYNMAGCKQYEVISCWLGFDEFKVATRFDEDNDLLFAFGY